jgi:hypothetical protein
MPDIFEDVKRTQEVTDRPGKTSPVPLPHELSNEYSGASYKMVAPKSAPKGPSMQDEMAAKAGMLEKARKALE